MRKLIILAVLCSLCGCVYLISDDTKFLAKEIHKYAEIQEDHIVTMLTGGEITEEKATEILDNTEALSNATGTLSELLGEPKPRESDNE
jgi:Mg2+ and Co2+ transporter CorA